MPGEKARGNSREKKDGKKVAQTGEGTAQSREGGSSGEDNMAPAPTKLLHEAANIFTLLSDESRLRIVLYLMRNNELNVSEICRQLGQTQPAVSHHLALLRVSGVIEARRSGKNIYYTVRTEMFNDLLARLLSSLGEMPKKMAFHDFRLSFGGR
jgi:ArsR family transcriptional regulator